MGTDSKQKLSKILDIAEAISVVGENSLLEGTVSYRLGRLGDYTKAPLKLYTKMREEKRKAIHEKQKALQKETVGASEEVKREKSLEIQSLNEQFNTEVEAILEQEEQISIPNLKLSDFLAKEERKTFETIGKNEDERKVEVIIKPGQALVPVRFFVLMGELIVDDKDALK